MSIRSQQFTVSTTAVELRPTGAPSSPGYKGATIYLTVGARDIFVGPSSAVTSTTGHKLLQNTEHVIRLSVSDRLYAIAASSGTDTVLRVE